MSYHPKSCSLGCWPGSPVPTRAPMHRLCTSDPGRPPCHKSRLRSSLLPGCPQPAPCLLDTPGLHLRQVRRGLHAQHPCPQADRGVHPRAGVEGMGPRPRVSALCGRLQGTLPPSWLAFQGVSWEAHSHLAPAERTGQWKGQYGFGHLLTIVLDFWALAGWMGAVKVSRYPLHRLLGPQSWDMLEGLEQESWRPVLPPQLLSPGSVALAWSCWEQERGA